MKHLTLISVILWFILTLNHYCRDLLWQPLAVILVMSIIVHIVVARLDNSKL